MIEIEPLKTNRFRVEFTEGLDILQPWRINSIYSNMAYTNKIFNFKIIETVIEPNLLTKNLIGLEVSFKIDYLNALGETVATEAHKGKIYEQSVSGLDMNQDDIIYTYITVKVDL